MGTLTLPIPVGEISDGYHTFNELYTHRCALFIALMKAHPALSWWSWLHHDGTTFDGYIIAGMNLPTGTITYHLDSAYVETLMAAEIQHMEDGAPEWDGHTANDVVTRLFDWIEDH